MSVTTLEGIIQDGKVVISNEVSLRESSRVYVVIPDETLPQRVFSPRLVHPEDALRINKLVEDDDLADEI